MLKKQDNKVFQDLSFDGLDRVIVFNFQVPRALQKKASTNIIHVASWSGLRKLLADLDRADLIILGKIPNKPSPTQLKLLAELTHEAGAILIIDEKDQNELGSDLKADFQVNQRKCYYKKKTKPSPKEYDQEYIDRWGEIDFLANAEVAAEQLIAHFPADFDKKKSTVLDVGCLNGYIMESLARAGVKRLYGTDISYSLAITNTVNRSLIPKIRIEDFLHNSYSNQAFDVTICMEVLEHIDPHTTDKFVEELVRVTKDTGRILISTSEDWDADPTHINCRNRSEWFEIFAKHGCVAVGEQVIFPGFNSFVLRKQKGASLMLSKLKSRAGVLVNGKMEPPKTHNAVTSELAVGESNLANREAWLEQALKKIPKGKRILDAGAGELQYKRFCSHLEYTSQDFGQYDGKGDSAGFQTESWDNSKLDITSDIASIPVKAKEFDAVMCIEVLEHIPHPIEALREFSRVIKKGGALIITAPVSSLTHFAPYYFYNGYSRYFYEKYLSDFGFEIQELTYNGNWYEALAQELRRLPSILEKYSPQVSLDKLDALAMKKILTKLEAASQHDKGSSELSSYGIHIIAKKK